MTKRTQKNFTHGVIVIAGHVRSKDLDNDDVKQIRPIRKFHQWMPRPMRKGSINERQVAIVSS
jgi:hypothetical protein